jgi:hypothetical protein
MVASDKVRKVACRVVRVPEHLKQSHHHSLADSGRSRPSDLLPWADPYIAQLVRNLQHEIRHERSQNRRQPAMNASPKNALPMNPAKPLSPRHHPNIEGRKRCLTPFVRSTLQAVPAKGV